MHALCSTSWINTSWTKDADWPTDSAAGKVSLERDYHWIICELRQNSTAIQIEVTPSAAATAQKT
jgi:hypothetical protein